MIFAILLLASAVAADRYPKAPDETVTPGSLCGKADEIRYPEKIAYCTRDVPSERKDSAMRLYDGLGFRVSAMGRQAFKIDHYIPLCMGGSNDLDNLWPQHLSLAPLTDDLEADLCERMSLGLLKQKDAMEAIKRAKADPDEAEKLRQWAGLPPPARD